MPDNLDHDGRQQLERLKQEHRALEEDFARRLARPSDGKGVEKDHANAIERGRAEASVASSDGTLEERGTQTSLNGGDRYLVKKQSDRTTVVENTKRVTGRGEWLREDFRISMHCDWFSFDAVNPPTDHRVGLR